MNWLSKNAEALQALGALATALIALAALVGVKFQLDSADAIQREQSARDAYRSHLALAVAQPQFVTPREICSVLSSGEVSGYYAFVDHLLYSAEQMLELNAEWKVTFLEELEPHKAYICSVDGPQGATENVAELLTEFRRASCTGNAICQVQD